MDLDLKDAKEKCLKNKNHPIDFFLPLKFIWNVTHYKTIEQVNIVVSILQVLSNLDNGANWTSKIHQKRRANKREDKK